MPSNRMDGAEVIELEEQGGQSGGAGGGGFATAGPGTMHIDDRWLHEKFPKHQVVCGMAVTNMTGHRLNLVDTYLHYGLVDDSFPAPRAVEPGSQAIIVAKNARAAAGT